MANEVIIKDFETLKTEFDAILVLLTSPLATRADFGPIDTTIATSLTLLEDMNIALSNALLQVHGSTVTQDDFMDLKLREVDLTRNVAVGTIKEFTLTRSSTSGVLSIDVGDIIKTIPLPAPRGEVEFASIVSEDPILAAANLAGEFADTVGSIIVRFQAIDAGTNANNIEQILDVVTTTMVIVSGLSGVDGVESTGEDAIPGTNLETNDEAFIRIQGQFSKLAVGATRAAYKAFAKDSSTAVFDANVTDDQPAGNPVDVEVSVSGPPGSRALTIGANEGANNFEPDYTDDAQPSIITGSHDGAGDSASLIDSTATFVTNNVEIGDTVKNLTDGSQATVTGVTSETELAMSLSGGTEDDWDAADLYEVDRSTGSVNPRVELGNTIHNFIRERIPLTDNLFLTTVLETARPLEVNILLAEGFTDLVAVKALVTARLRALFLIEQDVIDVTVLNVGEELLFSRLCRILSDTPGVGDFTFIDPSPSVNNGNTAVNTNEVLILSTITIGDL